MLRLVLRWWEEYNVYRTEVLEVVRWGVEMRGMVRGYYTMGKLPERVNMASILRLEYE